MDSWGALFLARYLVQTGTLQSDLAEDSGVRQDGISRYMHGRQRPGIRSALALSRATGEAVPFESWLAPLT